MAIKKLNTFFRNIFEVLTAVLGRLFSEQTYNHRDFRLVKSNFLLGLCNEQHALNAYQKFIIEFFGLSVPSFAALHLEYNASTLISRKTKIKLQLL